MEHLTPSPDPLASPPRELYGPRSAVAMTLMTLMTLKQGAPAPVTLMTPMTLKQGAPAPMTLMTLMTLIHFLRASHAPPPTPAVP